MNDHQLRLMGKPDIESTLCAFCGRPAANRHHIVPRSAGGGKGPTVCVCGMGNASGCHGLLHSHVLHLDWDDEAGCWVYLRTERPTKEDRAYMMDGWRPVRRWDDALSA